MEYKLCMNIKNCSVEVKVLSDGAIFDHFRQNQHHQSGADLPRCYFLSGFSSTSHLLQLCVVEFKDGSQLKTSGTGLVPDLLSTSWSHLTITRVVRAGALEPAKTVRIPASQVIGGPSARRMTSYSTHGVPISPALAPSSSRL